MKAIVHHIYGSPDVLGLEEVEKPTPGDDDVLIKIHAASANPWDWHHLRADPFLVRLMGEGFLKPKHKILGADIAGRVEAVGRSVRQFQPGDEVFGDISDYSGGGFAEYACAPVDALVPKPAGVTFEEAATAPMAAGSVLRGLREMGRILPGHKVLVNGASGGVGTFAVQITKSFGAEVTGVCGTRNLDMVRSIGAAHVIDYTREDFTRKGQHYDMILDAVGNRSVRDYKRALSPNGVCAIIGFSSLRLLFQAALLGPWISMTGNKKIGLVSAKMHNQDLVVLKELFEARKVVPVIDRRYTLSEVAEAIRYLEKGHARGKVVVTVEHDAKT
jgi:NADPH:quinone reductase-like Zn-dependent oxidoreductase